MIQISIASTDMHHRIRHCTERTEQQSYPILKGARHELLVVGDTQPSRAAAAAVQPDYIQLCCAPHQGQHSVVTPAPRTD